MLKLDESKKVEDLSLGNLKKVGIVLALMHNPKILILDEPTSGLDPIMQNIFFEILLEEKKKGTTILYSTHILNEVSYTVPLHYNLTIFIFFDEVWNYFSLKINWFKTSENNPDFLRLIHVTFSQSYNSTDTMFYIHLILSDK